MFVSCNAPKLYEFQENRIVFIIGVLFCVIKYLAPPKVNELMSHEDSKNLFSRLLFTIPGISVEIRHFF